MADNADHPQFDLTRPSLARVYDYFLGGSHNNARDRQLAADLESAWPHLPGIARLERQFLRRAIHRMLALGVRQFIDLGSGVPTANHIHELAKAHDPDSVVVYIDTDPATVAQSQVILRGDPNTTAIHADLRTPADIQRHHEIRRRIDHRRPIGITMTGILEHIPDHDNPADLISTYHTLFNTQTYLAITIVIHDTHSDPAHIAHAATIYREFGTDLIARNGATLKHWLRSMTIIDNDTTQPEQDLVRYALVH
jgi:hypothetical protein